MPVLIFDTGFLYSLVVDRTYTDAVHTAWEDRELWVPPSVMGEMTYRQRKPSPSIPPELPGRAKGLISSSSWNFQVLELTKEEQAAAESLRERIGDQDPNRNRAECEAAVLLVSRAPDASLRLDDKNCLTVIARYIKDETGHELAYATTTDVLDNLVAHGQLSSEQRDEIRDNLTAKGRPLP